MVLKRYTKNSAFRKFEYAFSSAVTFTYNESTTNNMAISSQEASGNVANSNFMALYIKNDKLKFRVGKINNDIKDYYEYTFGNLEVDKKYSATITYDGNGLTNGRNSYTITLIDFGK